jgi:ATP-dependent Clp protease ATP-binding subunit ClpA
MNTWQRFTEHARRIVFFAQEEATLLGEHYVSTEHLLLGLVREDANLAVLVLDQMEISSIAIRTEIEKHLTKIDGPPPPEMHLTERSKHVIHFAHEEAQQTGNIHIGTEHILLGLIREKGGIAERVLSILGADYETTREMIQIVKNNKDTFYEDNLTVAKRVRTRIYDNIGHIGIIAAEKQDFVEVAITHDAFVEMIRIFRSKDHIGYQTMIAANRILLLPTGTSVKRLVAERSQGIYVRFRDGNYKDKTGWIFFHNFYAIRPDDDVFPPAL